MDVQVVAHSRVTEVVERTAVHRALKKLTGAQVPNRHGAWAAWLRKRTKTPAKPADTPR